MSQLLYRKKWSKMMFWNTKQRNYIKVFISFHKKKISKICFQNLFFKNLYLNWIKKLKLKYELSEHVRSHSSNNFWRFLFKDILSFEFMYYLLLILISILCHWSRFSQHIYIWTAFPNHSILRIETLFWKYQRRRRGEGVGERDSLDWNWKKWCERHWKCSSFFNFFSGLTMIWETIFKVHKHKRSLHINLWTEFLYAFKSHISTAFH